MQIRNLHIRNFRSLRDVGLKGLGNFNIFVGKNSSGKSNLLEALTMFFNSFFIVGGNTAGLNEYYWFNKRTKNPIVFEIDIELSDNEIQEIFAPELLKQIKRFGGLTNTLTVKRRITNVGGVWETTALECLGLILVKGNKSIPPPQVLSPLVNRYIRRKKIKSPVVFNNPSSEELNAILTAISGIVHGKFELITQIRDVKNPIAHRTTLIDSKLQSSLWTLDQSIKSDEEEKCVEIENSFTNVTGKQLDPAQGQVYIRRQRRRFPLYLEGGGIQASIQLIFALKNVKDRYSCFGIEEPEAHSHSELQRRLFNELKTLSEDCQLFITTHSPTFIDRSNLKNVWISKFANGETIFERASELKEIVEELGIKPSDVLFFADRILFVEGKSEEVVIPIFAKTLSIDLKDVAVLSVEGKSKARLNLKTWLKITRGMLPIFLLLDKDAEAEIEQLKTENLIEPGQYHIWRRGAIESYYHIPLLKDALNELNERYTLEMDVNAIIERIEKGELLPDKIDLGEKQELLDKTLKVLLAESVAKLIREGKPASIPEEVRIALKEAIAN